MIERFIVVVLFDGVDLLDVTGPPEVFSLLQREIDEPTGYRVVLAAETPEPVTTSVGAHILAHAGLLDGKRATTHWSTAGQLAAEHPAVTVDADPIFIRDGDVWTGAGLTACLDLTLALVAEDFGREPAMRVARQLVMYLQRPGGQSQFSVSLDPVSTTRRVDDLRHHIARNLSRPLTVAALAAHAHIGERQLTRLFKAELGMTPAAYIEAARVEVARNRLETTDDTLDRVAGECGFGTTDTLTRAFRRSLGITPAAYRDRFRVRAEVP